MKSLLVCAIVLLAGTSEAATVSKAASNQPRFVLDDKLTTQEYDPSSQSVTLKFVVKNNGSGDLLLLSIEPSCRCVVLDYDRVIPSGKTGTISLSEDLTGEITSGKDSIEVRTNDAKHKVVQVPIATKGSPYLRAVPGQLLNLGVVRAKHTPKKAVTLCSDAAQLSLTLIGSSQPYLSALIREIHNSTCSNGREVTVLIADDAPLGVLRGTLLFATGVEKIPEVPVYVAARIVAAPRSVPSKKSVQNH